MNDTKSIEQLLAERGAYADTVSGMSMEPLLRAQRDVVVIETPKARPGKNDVVLYRRGESYVLHRIIRVLPDSYVILGDNCVRREHVPAGDVLGVLTGFYRKGKRRSVTDVGYRLYVAAVRTWQPLRIAYHVLRSRAAKIYHKMTAKR